MTDLKQKRFLAAFSSLNGVKFLFGFEIELGAAGKPYESVRGDDLLADRVPLLPTLTPQSNRRETHGEWLGLFSTGLGIAENINSGK